MKKAFYRLKKFYILVFVLIILISLGYIFLHRSLGLILWDRLYYEEEKKLILDDLYAVWGNEKEFIKYYNDFYLKENIAEKSKKTRMELLDNIKYFHFDFNAMKIFGLDKFYLQALMDKSDLYWADSGWNISYWVYNNQMDKIQINDISKYIEFLNSYNELVSFINILDDEDYFLYKVKFNAFMISWGVWLESIFTQKSFCKFSYNKELLTKTKNSNLILQKYKNSKYEKFFVKNYLNEIQNIIDNVEERISACERE